MPNWVKGGVAGLVPSVTMVRDARAKGPKEAEHGCDAKWDRMMGRELAFVLCL